MSYLQVEPSYRQGASNGALVHADHVEVRSEQTNLLVDAIVGLHALEKLKRVVKDLGSWMDAQILKFANLWFLPSFLRVPFDGEHVVSELGSKNELGRIIGQVWLGLGDVNLHFLGLLAKRTVLDKCSN